jgi:hypothetical protein
MIPSKSSKQKNLFFNYLSVVVLKVYDKNRRIRIHLVRGMDPRTRIRNKMSWIRNTGFQIGGGGGLVRLFTLQTRP